VTDPSSPFFTPAPAAAEPEAAAPEPTAAEAVAAMVGKIVRDDSGRYGLVVDAGRAPNPDHVDPVSRQPRPEGHEPLVIWLPVAAPFGHPLTVVG
jgi:hypothetical protein